MSCFDPPTQQLRGFEPLLLVATLLWTLEKVTMGQAFIMQGVETAHLSHRRVCEVARPRVLRSAYSAVVGAPYADTFPSLQRQLNNQWGSRNRDAAIDACSFAASLSRR